MKNWSFVNYKAFLEKEKVTLHDGHAREQIPGTTAVIITEVIHKSIYADLDGDNAKEAVSILMQHTGGTGSFYFVAVAAGSGKTIESYFLGDRVKITSVKIIEKLIVVDLLERSTGQPMASRPTERVSKKFELAKDVIVLSNK